MSVANATGDICQWIRFRNDLSSTYIWIEEIGKWSEKREFGPQIWSPEVTKSAAMVAADKISVLQSRQGA